MIFSESKNIVIPDELQKIIEEVLSGSIKLGSESSNKSKKQAQSWINWL